MSIELKIKSKHLSEEAKIIRFEERKLKRKAKWEREHQKDDAATMRSFLSLKSHRREDVRFENRATFLARAYLAGKEYSYAEQKRKPENEFYFGYKIIPRIVAMVNKYATTDVKVTNQDIKEWATLPK
jgi:predicted ATP-grasp superfamily ATP-dependent carboligase